MTRVGVQQPQQPASPQQNDDGKYVALNERSVAPPSTTASASVNIMYGAAFSTAQAPDVSRQDIAANVRVLRENFDTGATQNVQVRKQLLRQLKALMTEGEDALKEALWKDLHKHPTESYVAELALVNAEVQDHLDYLESWAKPELAPTNMANLPGLSYVHREPLGVVCVISTWNYPVNLLFVPLVAAISAGNCVLVRLPGDDTTMHLNQVFIALLDKYMDNRYVRYVYGGVEETKAMLRERYDLIFATGGCFLGKIVAKAAAEHLTPVVLELGGKSPVIVDETTDLALAARRIAWGAFTNSGQTCVRPDYVLVDAKIGDAFVRLLEETVLSFYGQDPKRSECYGRIVNQRSFERMKRLLVADRDHITFGGDSDESERYVQPTILNFRADFDGFRKSAAMSDEIFGPLLPIYYYETGDLTVPIQFIKRGEKPLALYLFSTSSRNKQRVVQQTTAGSMVINDCMVQLANGHVPFGGVGTSGMGAYHGRHGFEAFSHRKPVIYKYSLLDLSARYAPYSAQGERLLRIVQFPYSRNFFLVVKLLGFAVLVLIIALIISAAV
ncbi:Aldehyde dehydrogenase [Globisporangium polare]